MVDILASKKGANIIGIEAETDCRARKTNNPFGVIFKHVRAVGFCGADYEIAVINEGFRQNKEIEFTSEPLPWGVWKLDGKVIEHKGNLYLRLQTTSGQRKRQPAKILSYRAENGRFVSYEEIKSFLPEKRESQKQLDAGLKTESEIMVRTYAFNSIKKIRINGETFILNSPYSTEQIKQNYAKVETTIRPVKQVKIIKK